MGVSKNSTVAFYGKGGAGKSFLTSMVAKTLTDRNKRVLQMGCDPKHDSVVTHFGGAFIPTVLGTWAQFQKDGKDDDLAPEHIIFKGDGVYCIELGGPESARGCGGRGITFGFQMLEKWGLSEWNFNYMLLDFLGDVVCGGFAAPLQHSDRALIVAANDFDSIFAMNRIVAAIQAKARNYEVRLAGVIANRSAGTDQIDKFNNRTGLKTLAHFPDLDVIRRSRLKKSTLFEMDPTPEIVAVQNEYLRLAALLLAGTEPLETQSMKDRDIFDLLGFD